MTPMTRAFALTALPLMLVGTSAPAQTPATSRVMREKLAHAQSVLEALTTSNHESLQRHSAELSRATRSAGWAVLKTPEYRRYSDAFLHATENLARAASDRDLDEAMVHYLTMTMSCYQCHRYVKGTRIAGR